jgi:hypothetical protein
MSSLKPGKWPRDPGSIKDRQMVSKEQASEGLREEQRQPEEPVAEGRRGSVRPESPAEGDQVDPRCAYTSAPEKQDGAIKLLNEAAAA